MLVFIDESGFPHPHDPASRPVLAAVCMRQQDSREISRMVYAIQRQVLGPREQYDELKARNLVNRRTFRRVEAKRELVEAFFAGIRNMPITLFAVVMRRPQQPIVDSPRLPDQYRYLLQRAHLLLPDGDKMAAVVVDGDGSHSQLSAKFQGFLHRSNEGRALHRIMDAPFFVDSEITTGIQIADMVAGVIRIYQENELHRRVPPGDSFLSAIARYYEICHEKTRDQFTESGFSRPGFFFLAPGASAQQGLVGEQDFELAGEELDVSVIEQDEAPNP